MSPKSRRGPGGAKLIGGAVLAATVIGGGWLIFGGSGEPEPRIFEPDSEFIRGAEAPPQAGSAMPDPDEFVSRGVIDADGSTPADEVAQADTTDRSLLDTAQPGPSGALVATDSASGSDREPPRASGDDLSAGVSALVNAAREQLSEQDLVGARDTLNLALRHPEASDQDRARIRGDMAVLNEDLFFGSKVYEGDPLAFSYTIEPGDRLSAIAANRGLGVDWRLIQRINRIASPNRIRVGQKLKLVQGPMHAVVDKSDYRLDLYAGPPGAPDQWMYIRSFAVGLGENDSTPVGKFIVRPQSKLINPVWRNPRTGEFFAADHPENPIGEHWVGLEGTGSVAGEEGMGVHGTIEPESIGTDASMGCVRLVAGEIDIVYECLEESVSEVHIQP